MTAPLTDAGLDALDEAADRLPDLVAEVRRLRAKVSAADALADAVECFWDDQDEDRYETGDALIEMCHDYRSKP